MSNNRYFRDIEVVESDDRFETAEAIPDSRTNIHHVRVSKKVDDDGHIARVAIQAFQDEATPDRRFGIQMEADAATLDRVVSALELIRTEVNDGM